MSKESEKIKRKIAGKWLGHWHMPGSAVGVVAEHYQKKRGIKIYKNGETKFGQEKILENQKNSYQNKKLEQLNNKQIKYAAFIQEIGFVFNIEHSLHKEMIGYEKNALLKRLVKDYLADEVRLRELDEKELETLNEAISNSPVAVELLDPLIEKYCDYLEQEIANIGIKKKQAREEITAIQKQLKAGEAVGYIYTNEVNISLRHFEVVIITPEIIIKPISWHFTNNQFKPKPENAYVSFDRRAVLKALEGELPSAQVDEYTCGTLSFMYAKELLKNNAQQLKESTLRFPYYDQNGRIQWFFYPSPQTLRYSQSKTYNELIRLMLIDDPSPQTCNSKKNRYQVETLVGLLTRSIEKAHEQGNMQIVEHNSKILNKLGDFRQKWLEGYDEAMKKRDKQQDGNTNKYLAYSSRRMQARSETTNQGIQNLSSEKLLDVLNDYTPEEILDLPLSSKVHKQIFENDSFWELQLKKYFPSAQRNPNQLACDCFWETYAQQYDGFSLRLSSLFSLTNANKLQVDNFPFKDVFSEELLKRDKSGFSVVDRIALNRNQTLLDTIYKNFPRVRSLEFAVSCMQPLGIVQKLESHASKEERATAFIKATLLGQFDIATYLLKGLENKTSVLEKALKKAVSSNQQETINYLLEFAQKDIPDHYASMLRDVFHEAISQGNLKLIQRMFANNLQEQLSKQDFGEGFQLAISQNQLAIVKYFQNEKGYKTTLREIRAAIAKDNVGMLDHLLNSLPESERQDVRTNAFVTAAGDGKLSVVTYFTSSEKPPSQILIGEALQASAKSRDFNALKVVLHLIDKNPSQACVNAALIAAANASNGGIINCLSSLKGGNKPSPDTVKQVLTLLIKSHHWEKAKSLCTVSYYKPDATDETLKFLISHSEFALFKTVYKNRLDGKLNKQFIKDCLEIVERKYAPEQFKNWLKNANYPASYDNLTRLNDSKIQKIRTLLDDYTKDDSAVSRFFHGHWNRHNAKAVAAIVKNIDENPDITLTDISEQLNAIQPKNETGSFARRRQYIFDIIQIDRPEEQVDNSEENRNTVSGS